MGTEFYSYQAYRDDNVNLFLCVTAEHHLRLSRLIAAI